MKDFIYPIIWAASCAGCLFLGMNCRETGEYTLCDKDGKILYQEGSLYAIKQQIEKKEKEDFDNAVRAVILSQTIVDVVKSVILK